MQPNVFWMVKDWKEPWDAADLQKLLDEARGPCNVYDVPSRAFCDDDTIAVGPPDMRNDEDTASLLHDLSFLSVPGTDIELDLEVH